MLETHSSPARGWKASAASNHQPGFAARLQHCSALVHAGWRLGDIDAFKNELLYHVVAGDKSSRALLKERTVETLQGSDVHVYSWWGRVYVNRSQVIDANIGASNGTVHAINHVLLPSSK